MPTGSCRLADLEFNNVEVHQTAQHLYGYQGDIRPQTAEVIVRRQYIGSASNDIGFKQQEDGTFEAIISEYNTRSVAPSGHRAQYSQDWLNRLTQRYGYHALMATAQEQGFDIESDEILSDGNVRVVVGRWM